MEDCAKAELEHVDQFEDIKKFAPNMIEEIKIGESFYDVTTEKIADRVL